MSAIWDAEASSFPARKELPPISGAPAEAAWFWGKDDQIGRLNLLTPARIKAAAAAKIKTGEIASLNLPLDVPKVPGFGRQPFEHTILPKSGGLVHDDTYTLNTQSGTQWDGFRHFAHMPTGTFYNGATSKDFVGPEASMKCSIHYWTDHGIAGRGVLIDYRSYAHKKDIEYDPFERYAITWQELYNCGKDQGIDIRPEAQGGDIKVGDMLFIRSGFVEKYNTSPAEVRKEAALRGFGDHTNEQHQWAGVAQGDEMLDWIHDCYFSTVAGDAPAFEVWPKFTEQFLHEYILSLWGIPLGEMLDLEKLSELCKKNNRWTFFVTSAPANVPGGVASHVNGIAIF